MMVLDRYIAAWLAADPEAIAACVTTDCVAIECYGPVYRGRDKIQRWAQTWFAAGGSVHRWDVSDAFAAGDRELAQWDFECTWHGDRATFQGCTIATIKDGRLHRLREYQTSAPLYEWEGHWLEA